MSNNSDIPTASYGVLEQKKLEVSDEWLEEQFVSKGFVVLDLGLSSDEIHRIQTVFDSVYGNYIKFHGENNLRNAGELHTIRAPLLADISNTFLNIALHPKLLATLATLFKGKFILNQQNGVINPPFEKYSQGAWHRDLPYQHFVVSRPIAISALLCVDDFTSDNGATFVLPHSHQREEMPSPRYIENNALQVSAKAGQLIVINSMTYHSGGYNKTSVARRAINHVYTLPFFKQQINLPKNLQVTELESKYLEILGFNFSEPSSVSEYLEKRFTKSS